MKHVTVSAFKEVIEAEGANPSVDFINVCTPAEYKEKHIPGVRNVPLDALTSHLDEFADKRTIYVHCRSGKRGAQAVERFAAAGVTAELVNVEGGLTAWDAAGFATRSLTNRLPLMRQVLLVAGALVLIGSVLGLALSPAFAYLTGFVGAGLVVAGATGWCGMATLLARMPWNR